MAPCSEARPVDPSGLSDSSSKWGPSAIPRKMSNELPRIGQRAATIRTTRTVSGLVEQVPDGGAQRTVVRETHVAEDQQAEAIQAGGVEAVVVVVAVPLGHSAEVPEGGGAGSLLEGALELRESDRGLGSEQGEHHKSASAGAS